MTIQIFNDYLRQAKQGARHYGGYKMHSATVSSLGGGRKEDPNNSLHVASLRSRIQWLALEKSRGSKEGHTMRIRTFS